jgi:adenylyl-sulfate kinase
MTSRVPSRQVRSAANPAAGTTSRGEAGRTREGSRSRGELRVPGLVVWFTGLPGAGKTTQARELRRVLESRGHPVEHLDGDEIRMHLSPDLGFSRDDRRTNASRTAWVASRLASFGVSVLVSLVSPYEADRRLARSLVEATAPFFEVYVSTPIEICAARDPKGLYARGNEIACLTGISDPYETPARPDLVISTEDASPAETTREILVALDLFTARRSVCGRSPEVQRSERSGGQLRPSQALRELAIRPPTDIPQ